MWFNRIRSGRAVIRITTHSRNFTLAAGKWAMALGCMLSLASESANAADMQVIPASDSEAAVIIIEGDIQKGDDAKFRKIAAEQSNANVVLSSDGGAIVPAMDIGRTIRLREYRTVVFKDTSCVSACALIWLAGERRVIFEGGRVGFHASYLNVDGSLIETGMGNALVGHYLSQLGLGQKTVMFATAAPPYKILWLDTSTAALSAIEYDTVPNKQRPTSGRTELGPHTLSSPPKITLVPAQNQPVVDNYPGATPPPFERWLAATNETIRNVETFTRGLRQRGYQAEIDSSDLNSPNIITGLGGSKLSI